MNLPPTSLCGWYAATGNQPGRQASLRIDSISLNSVRRVGLSAAADRSDKLNLMKDRLA